jgi:hypothetical protein
MRHSRFCEIIRSKIVLLALALGSIILGCNQQPNLPSTISPREYVVYRQVVSSMIEKYGDHNVFIFDSTLCYESDSFEAKKETTSTGKAILHYRDHAPFTYAPRIIQDYAIVWKGFHAHELMSSMDSINNRSGVLEIDSISSIAKSRSHNLTIIDSLRAQIRSYDPYDSSQAEPSDLLIIYLSRVAFDRLQDQALVYMEYWRGPLNAAGKWIWCKKSDRGWYIEGEIGTWVS